MSNITTSSANKCTHYDETAHQKLCSVPHNNLNIEIYTKTLFKIMLYEILWPPWTIVHGSKGNLVVFEGEQNLQNQRSYIHQNWFACISRQPLLVSLHEFFELILFFDLCISCIRFHRSWWHQSNHPVLVLWVTAYHHRGRNRGARGAIAPKLCRLGGSAPPPPT